ncbi:hypothetical protein TNCV_3947501 [Trichonephila clavipes]|nr:hypothetical protein TNCV_3947501 [Trichonephila clavipes]
MEVVNYQNKIADSLHPYTESAFLTGNEIFQQDNTPCHKPRIVLECSKEYKDEFKFMSSDRSMIAEQCVFHRHFDIPLRGRVPDRKCVSMWMNAFRPTGKSPEKGDDLRRRSERLKCGMS